MNDDECEDMIEAVAKALCDTCYGEGAWDNILRSAGTSSQVRSWKSQALAAINVIDNWKR